MKRPLFLHHSALSPDEFGPLTLWLQELLPPTTGPAVPVGSPESLATDIRVDDVGRFLLERLRVDEEVWEDILSLFHPSHTAIQPRYSTSQSHLRPLAPLTAGQVLALLRLVVHASTGRDTRSEGLELAFRQAAVPIELIQAPSRSLFASYLAKKHAKPPPPPLHLHRRPSAHQKGATSVEGTPPGSPNPHRRASLRAPPPPPSRSSTAPLSNINVPVPRPVSDSPQGLTLSDSEYLHKVIDEDSPSSSSDESSSSDDEGQESVGRRHLKASPVTDARLTNDMRSSPAPAQDGGASSNPFRARLQSVPASAGVAPLLGPDLFRTMSTGQDATSASRSPSLPPRPPSTTNTPLAAQRHAPPLPPRSDQSYTQSSTSSAADPQVRRSPAKKAPPPARPAKPAGLTTGRVSSAFRTSELVHRSLAAAEDARREAELAPDKARHIEVIGSSSPTKERGPARTIRAQHSGGRGSSVGSSSKWKAVNATLNYGKPELSNARPKVGSHTLGQNTSQSSPLAELSAEYPFPLSTAGPAVFEDPPLPPPVRRNSSLSKPTTGSRPSSSGYSINRHTSLSSRLSGKGASLSTGGGLHSDDLRSTFDQSVRAFSQVAEGGADLLRQSRKSLPLGAAAPLGWGSSKGRGDRERLMDTAGEGDASGERDSADESREDLRGSLDRAEGYRPLR